jgi:hypothetical protein
MKNRGLDFDRHGNRLRYVPSDYMRNVLTEKGCRCFPHVVNLAVQAILEALSDSAKVFRQTSAQTGQLISEEHEAYLRALESEPHNRIRRTAVALRHTQRRQGVRRTIREGNEERIWRAPKLIDGVWKLEEFSMRLLELILDCPTRWSSTRNMIERFLYLYPVRRLSFLLGGLALIWSPGNQQIYCQRPNTCRVRSHAYGLRGATRYLRCPRPRPPYPGALVF